MRANCPRNWHTRIGPFEDYTVSICDDLCDCSDMCGMSDCRFYDLSQEATRRFIKACNFEHSPAFWKVEKQMLADLHVKIALEREKHGTERPDKTPDDRNVLYVYNPD